MYDLVKKIFYVLFFILFIFIIFSNNVEATEYEKIINKATMYIDNPIYMQNEDNTLFIRGWVMSTTSNISINVYIDNKLIDILERNQERPDVLKAISGYGGKTTNPVPGFAKTIKIPNVLDGVHILKIVIKDNYTGQVLTSSETKINIKKYNTKTHIDSPKYNENNKHEMLVRGWVMSTTSDILINAYIDNKLVYILERNEKRPDVLNAIIDCGKEDINPTPGFNKIIDISNLTQGIHTLEIQIRNKATNEILAYQSTIFYVDNYDVNMYIDNPINSNIVSNKIFVRGWVMSYVEDISIKLYIDENLIDVLERNQERPDVLKAILGYGGKDKNPIPGFIKTIDISNILDGNHVLKIKVVNENTNKVLKEETKKIYIKKYKTKMHIDSPINNQSVQQNVLIRGWVMSENENIEVQTYINNKLVTTIERNENREDVLKAITGYGGENTNPVPGFNKTVDLSSYKKGSNKITIKIIDKNTKEILQYKDVYINIKEDIDNKEDDESVKQYYNGIDVSHHQGTIDWKKVKNDNIDFAIIRAGFRGYGETGSLNKDTKFDYNIKNAIANNIDVGIYFFSQAITVEEAIEEAKYTLELIKDYKITYPVIIDVEYANEAHTGRADSISKELRTDIVIAFCETIKNAGYKPMFYTDKWFLSENLNVSKLTNYEYWLAHYTGATRDNPFLKLSDYKGKYSMWQYTAKGKVDGIQNNVDLNIAYKRY